MSAAAAADGRSKPISSPAHRGARDILRDAGDFIVLTNATTTTVRAKGATTPASCQVVYTRSAAANTPPVITSTLTNCN